MGLQQLRSADDFGGFAGARHQHDLFGAYATERFFRSEEEFGSGNSGRRDVGVLVPERGDEPRKIVARAATNQEPGAAGRERLDETFENPGVLEAFIGFPPDARLREDFRQSVFGWPHAALRRTSAAPCPRLHHREHLSLLKRFNRSYSAEQ